MLAISFVTDATVRGTLFMDKRRVRKLTNLTPSGLAISQGSQQDLDRIESFIEHTYRHRYGSTIARHYPTLMSVTDSDGNVLAAVGVRLAAEEPLFLEQYLKRPVEAVLRDRMGSPSIERDSIVEIGNLASAGKGASVFLFVALAAYLRQQKLAYAVVTGTTGLRRSLESFGIEFLKLGTAEPTALPDNGASWGGYYNWDPEVIAGAIQPAFDRLEPFLPARHNGDLERLFTRVRRPVVGAVQ
jgi:hypothetical protein